MGDAALFDLPFDDQFVYVGEQRKASFDTRAE